MDIDKQVADFSAQLDRTLVTDDGIVTLGLTHTRVWLNYDGSFGRWDRPQGNTGPMPAEQCHCPISRTPAPAGKEDVFRQAGAAMLAQHLKDRGA